LAGDGRIGVSRGGDEARSVPGLRRAGVRAVRDCQLIASRTAGTISVAQRARAPSAGVSSVLR